MLSVDSDFNNIIVEPGDCVFSQENVFLFTVLGSCVSLTAWHKGLQVGGMCHYLLPQPLDAYSTGEACKYGCYALKKMAAYMGSYADVGEYELGLYGGSHFNFETITPYIGDKNIQLARLWLASNKLSLNHESVGGSISRSLRMDLSNGRINMH